MEENQSPKIQEYEFKAEMKQLLNLIVHSLYTHPEIFLRELVSNASDALNKVRFRKLTDSDILDPESELKISISLNKDGQTFEIEDTGIGMTKEELIEQIGTVASSGTLQFLQKIKENNSNLTADLIGQFGVGFYSVFMVTDEVTIETRSIEKDSKAYRWKSKGDGIFTIEEIEKENRGTRIYFKLKDEHKQFCDDNTIKSILNKYSNFVDFPIYLNGEKVNTVSALWHRRKEDIKEEELIEFYKFISNDYEEPLGHLHLSLEGVLNFKALLFIPKTAPLFLFRDFTEKSLLLYSKKVFIQDDCKELLPDYLKFIKGVVDTEDLPLNVSREVTQYSPVMAKINNILTSKILSFLEDWLNNEKEKYIKFFKNFGSIFKLGLNSDFTNRDKIINLILFETSKTAAEELISFKDYVSRMKENQNEIYYVIGNTREAIQKNPNLEYFLKNDLEVIFLTDPVDVFTIPQIGEYEKKRLVSVDKSDIKFEETTAIKADSLSPELSKTLLDVFKRILGDKVEDVRESVRLVDSPVTLVVGKSGMDKQLEKMMQYMDKDFKISKRILEVNMTHPIIKNLAKRVIADENDEILRLSVLQLYEGALLMEGYLQEPAEFVSRMNEIILNATKV
ncbi:MAG: molecular chaperone HtpG [Candidatus Kapabacteria bacterium]|nr:molecular chaperone HtpG [Candidatus Kapabacteria bacterium]